MPKQNTIKVVAWTQDTHPKKGKYAGKTAHDTLHLKADPKGIAVKHADLPEYILNALLAGRTQKVNKHSGAESVYRRMLDLCIPAEKVHAAAGKKSVKDATPAVERTRAENLTILSQLASDEDLAKFVESL